MEKLIEQYRSGQISRAELEAGLRDHWNSMDKADAQFLNHKREEMWAAIMRHEQQTSAKVRRMGWLRYAAAAVFLIAVSATYLLFNRAPQNPATTIAKRADVAPGKPGAKLKLSDGRMIMIDTVKDGLIAMEGKLAIYKTNGKIEYKGTTDQLVYNEIVTDKGRQWSATLPDGSTAWLNAGSTLRYPLHFSAKERLVSMTGEASFKVVHNAAQPFRVAVNHQLIEDIGTEFNVNAYSDEPVMRTTVLEGKISTAGHLVKAGEEAVFNGTQTTVSVAADANSAVSWRNGTFSYSHAGIAEIMRQMGRWYNVEIVYEKGIPDETFTGDIGRSLTLEQALKVLEKMSAHFKIEEGKRIIITP